MSGYRKVKRHSKKRLPVEAKVGGSPKASRHRARWSTEFRDKIAIVVAVALLIPIVVFGFLSLSRSDQPNEQQSPVPMVADPASQVKDHSFGDPGLSGAYDLVASDVSDEAGAHESGSGVLARLTLRAAAPGVTKVTLEEPFLFPFQSVGSIANAFIAVDQECPGQLPPEGSTSR